MAEEAALLDPKAFKQLEEKLYADKKWPELISAYESRAIGVQDLDQRERLLFQAGQLAEQKLQDTAGASAYYKRAFEVRKTFVRALGALRALHADKKDHKAVAQAIELELTATTDKTKSARLQKELGDALANQEGLDPEEPIKAYMKALELDSKQRGALVELEKLCRKHAKWNKLVAAYKKLADTTTGKDAAVFHFFAGTILDERLKQYDYAARAFKSSLEAGSGESKIITTIASFFEKRKAWDDCVAAHEALVPLGENNKEKAKLLRKMGSIAEKSKGDHEAAIKYYRRAVDVRHDDADGLSNLRRLYEEKKDDVGLADVYELEAFNLELQPDEKADRLEKAAGLREKAGDFDRACRNLYTVIELKPRSPRALKSIENLTRKLGRWQEHARALELEAALLDPKRSEDEKKATLAIEKRLSEVKDKQLKDPKGALASLSRILTIDPDDLDTLQRVETLARKLEDHPRVAQALARRLEKTKDDLARSKIAVELATVREDHLDDAKGAAEAWEDALVRDRALSERALAALRRLYEKAKDHAGLSKTLSRLVEAAQASNRPPTWRAQLLRDLGAAELGRARAPGGGGTEALAAAKALREALSIEPSGEGADAARRLLVDADRAHGKGDALRRSLTDLASNDPDPAFARSARLELARIEEKEQRPAEAIKILEEQLALTPADDEALPHAARLLAALGQPLEAADKLELASRSLEHEEPLKASSFAKEAARILEKEAAANGDETSLLARARDAWGRTLELNADDDAAAERYADLCRKTNDSTGLDVILERAAARAGEPASRAKLNKERAALARGPLAKPEQAVSLYERALRDAVNDAEATGALLALYRQLEKSSELADLLEQISARSQTGPETRPTDRLDLKPLATAEGARDAVPNPTEALREAAEVASDKLGDYDRAVSCLERLVGVEADDERALQRLAEHYEKLERPRDLERTLDRLATLADEPNEKAALLIRRGAILEKHLQDTLLAAKTYEAALQAKANDRSALEGLARCRGALGDHRGAFEALAKAAEAALAEGDATGAASIELTRGDIARSHRDLAGAEAAYRAAIARIPSFGRAHDALAELLTEKNDWAALDAALAAGAETAEGARKAEMLIRRSDVLTYRLDKGDEALKGLEKAEQAARADGQGGDASKLALVLDARARALRRLHRPGPLADTLAARRALGKSLKPAPRKKGAPDPIVVLLREEAHQRAFSLDELEKARALLDEARKLSGEEPHVLADLLRVERRASGGQRKNIERLIELLEAAAKVEQNPKKKADLLVEGGRAAKVRKNDPAKAKALFTAALGVEPVRLEAMRWLQALAQERKDEDELASWLGKEAEVETDGRRRSLVHARLGDCHRRRGKDDSARKSYESSLADDPNNPLALRHLAPLLRRAKDWTRLASVLERLARVEPDKHARRERLVMLGEVRLRKQADKKGARQAFDEALTLEADDLDALRGKARTLDPKKEAKELVEVLTKELRLTPSAARRADLHKVIGELRFERLNDLDGAAKAFSAAIRMKPDDDGARVSLRQVYMGSKDWTRLAKSYEEEGRRATDRVLKEERFRQAALVFHHHLGLVDKAIGLYKEVLALGDPECLAITLLPKLLESKPEERFEVLARIPDIVPGSREAQEALLEIGAHKEQKSDYAGAQAVYERILEKDPAHVRALDALVALHRGHKDLPRLADALDRKIKNLKKGDRVKVRLDRGAVLEELTDLDGAALEYEAAALEDPKSRAPLERLRTVYRRRERWPQLIRALGMAFERSTDDEQAAKLLLEKAEVEVERQKDPRAALESLRRAQQRAKAGPLGLEVAQRTVALLSTEDLPDELAQALEVRSTLLPAGAARARSLAEAAAVYDQRLGRADSAIDAWNRALDEMPQGVAHQSEHKAALAQLQELCARSKDKRGRARALEREMDLVLLTTGELSPQDRERLVACALEAAMIHEDLEDVDAAARALELALDRDASSKQVFEELAQIYEQRKHDVRLFDLLKRRVRATTDRPEQAVLFERMAVLAQTLGEDDSAVVAWNELLVRRPKDAKALASLKALHAEREEWEDAARVGEQELVVVAEHSVKRETQRDDDTSAEGFSLRGTVEVHELHIALGELYEKKLSNAQLAVQHFELAHARAPRDPRPLRGVERLRAAADDWEAVSRARSALRDLEDDPQKRAGLALGVASAEEKLGRRADAIAALRSALEDVPDNASALALLRQHLLELERWDEAAQVLAREADVARERATQVQRRLERARLLREKLQDEAGSVQELERARGLDPTCAEALQQLEELYTAHLGEEGIRARLAAVLDDRARIEKDGQRSAELLTRVGRVLSEEVPEGAEGTKQLTAAAEAYERALLRARDESGEPIAGVATAVLDLLIELWHRLDRPVELARSLHRRAELATSAVEMAGFLRRAAEIEERSLEDPETAAATLEALTREAKAEDGFDLDGALAELARLRGALGHHSARELALARRTELAPGPDERRTLLLERARLLEEQLERPGAAAQCVQEVLLLFKDDAGLADELARLREAAGDALGVVHALDHALDLAAKTGDVERLRALHRRRGDLCSGAAYDPEKALASLQALLEFNPDDDSAREPLEALLAREGRARELAEHLAAEVQRRMARKEDRKVLAGLERRRAEILRGPLAAPDRAEKAYRSALELDPDDQRAREGLEALLRSMGQQEALAALLAENAERAPNDVVAAEALREEAQVHEQRGDKKTAIARLEESLKRVPDDRRTLRALVRLYRITERVEDLANVLSLLVHALGSQPPAERAQVLVERGLVLARELKQPQEGEEALDEALDLDPKSVPAARALAPLLIARQAWAEVVRVYDLEAQSGVDRPRRVWLRTEIGRIRRDLLNDQDGGARAFQEALALDAGSVAALVGLASVLRARSRHADLATPLERLAELSPSPEDKLEAKRELAHLYEEKLNDAARAGERYKQVLVENSRDADAVQGLARCLRKQLATEGRPAGGLGALRASLVDAVERELALGTAAPARKFELLVEAAQLHEQLAEDAADANKKKRLEATARCAREACDLKPQDTEALATYARVAEKLGRWEELANATERLSSLVDDKARAAWMLRRVGKLRGLRLGDQEGAARAFEQAAAIDPRDREAYEALEPIARDLRDSNRALFALRGQLNLAADDMRRATVAVRLGETYEAIQDYPHAIEAYVLAREKGKAPHRKDAQKALDRCYRATERWTDLARILEARIQSEPEHAAALLLERAKVCEERLARFDKAAEALSEALRVAPEDGAAAKSLERILTHTERWDELAEFYEQESGRRGPRGYDTLVKLGKLYRDQLEENEKAAAALQRAASLNPTGLEAIEALRDLYTKIERWPELLEVLRLEVALVKEPRAREARFLRAARVAEEKLGDLQQAARFYHEASMLSPTDRAHLSSLARVQEARGDEEGLVRTLERDLALTRDPAEVVATRKKLGHVYAKRLFRRTDAQLAYREALKIDPDDDEALASLADLLRDASAWAELAPVLDRRAARARGRDALPIRLELARVLAGKLGRSEEALRMATAARSLDPRSPEAVQIEVEVLKSLGRNDELADALARLAASRTDAKERAIIQVELADHLQNVLKRPDRALRALEEALQNDPVSEAAIERATKLQEAMGRWDDLLETYERAFGLAPTPQRRASLRAKSAEVLELRKSDPINAERVYREALAEDAQNLAATAGLARSLHTQGFANRGGDAARAEELEQLELRRAELERDPIEKAKALARAGDVARDALEDYDTAQKRYEAALQTSPDLFVALAPLAELHFGRERPDDALPLLERCAVSPDLGGDPERAADLLHGLAICREHKGDREGAAAALKAALEHKASHAQVLEDLARLLVEDGAFHAAIPILEDLVTRTRVPAVRATHELALARALSKTNQQDRALDIFPRGLERQPDDHASRLAYAELLLERQDLSAARRELEKVALASPPAPPEVAAKARVHLADIFESALRDLDGAAKHLAVAVELEGKHRSTAARRLAELHARGERWEEAAKYLAKAVELEPAGPDKAELYAKLGRLFRDRIRKPELARKCLEKSFELVPTDRHTLDSLGRLLEQAGDFAALEQAYAKAAAACNKGGLGDEAAHRLKRAEVIWKRLEKPKAAAKELEAVLQLEPSHTGARAMLAQIYLETNDVKGVERIYREMVHEDPLAVDHYRALAACWKDAGQKDAVVQTMQAIAVLQAANDEEKAAATEQAQRAPKARRGLRADEWVKIIPRELVGSIYELVTGLSDAFDKSIPEDLKSYGLGMLKRSLPLEGDGFPEHKLVKRVTDLLGIKDDELDLYWMGDWKRPEAILAHGKKTPALILCPAVFAGLSEPEKAYVIARAIALVPARLEAVRAMVPRELEKFILAAVKSLHPDLTSFSGEDEKETRNFMAKVQKALTPELIEKLKPHAAAVARRPDKPGVEVFRRAASLVASRAGVLAAGGAYPSVMAVVKTNVAMRGRLATTTAEVVRDFREVAELKDILEFSVSEGHLEMRKTLWLASKGE